MLSQSHRRRILIAGLVLGAGILAVLWTQRRIIDPRFEGTWALDGWGEDDLFVTLNQDGTGRFKTSEHESLVTIEWWITGDSFYIDHRPHWGTVQKVEALVHSVRGGRSPISHIEIVEVDDDNILLRAEDGNPVTMTRADP